MSDLVLSATLSLPAAYITETGAILARRGAGKTYAAMRLAEEMGRLGLPFVAVDPTGVMWGLRSSADGTKSGLPIIILGGGHGDLPLESTSGRLIADFVVESGNSVILDLSYFESRAAETRFLTDFATRLYRYKAMHKEPLHLLLDEADRYAPQKVTGDLAKLLGAWEAIVKLGRSRGLGMTMITQRPATLNKNVLSQIEVLIVMQITGTHDRKAIMEWVGENATVEEAKEMVQSLASLQKGEAWVWSPGWLRVLLRIVVAKRWTFDSSRTPEVGEVLQPKKVAEVDLDALAMQMAETIEKAEASDPKKLQARVRELEAEVGRLSAVPAEVRVETIEVVHQVVPPELREILTEAVMLLDNAVAVADAEPPAPSRSTQFPRVVDVSDGGICRPFPPVDVFVPARRAGATPDGSLSKAERAILSVLVQAPSGGFTRRQMSIRSGYPYKSKSIDNALGALRGRGYINPGLPLVATEAGVDALPDVEPLPRGEALYDYWMGQLDKAGRAVLTVFREAHDGPVTRTEVAEATGYDYKSKSLDNALGKLRGLDLVDGWILHPDFAQAVGL